MKNKEKHYDELIQIIVSGRCLAVDKYTNRPKQCDDKIRCVDCLFYEMGCNSESRKEWLEKEYQEPITLTDDEKTILRNIDKKWRWIARDGTEWLFLYKTMPRKIGTVWDGYGTKHNLGCYEHLFKFIKWKDKEPYNIDELLKQNGVER